MAAGRKGGTRCPLCGGRAFPWIGIPNPETGATVGLASPVDPDDPATADRARLIDRCEDCASGIEQGDPVDLAAELEAITVATGDGERTLMALEPGELAGGDRRRRLGGAGGVARQAAADSARPRAAARAQRVRAGATGVSPVGREPALALADDPQRDHAPHELRDRRPGGPAAPAQLARALLVCGGCGGERPGDAADRPVLRPDRGSGGPRRARRADVRPCSPARAGVAQGLLGLAPGPLCQRQHQTARGECWPSSAPARFIKPGHDDAVSASRRP